MDELDHIGPALSFNLDVTTAKSIKANRKAGCYQGQTHGHKSFLMRADLAQLAIVKDPTGELKKVLRPFLIADELIGNKDPRPQRYVIDFRGLDVLQARKFGPAYTQLERSVLPQREAAAKKEEDRNKAALAKNPGSKVNKHHANFLKKWWLMSYPREDMMKAIAPLKRYIVCGQVTKRPIFEFVSTNINPNAALVVFSYDDDYSFGVLQSDIHWQWFINRCSTLTERFRYTSNTVWDSFPWPQSPSAGAVKKVAAAAEALRRRVSNDGRFSAFMAGVPSYIDIDGLCPRCGNFRRRTRDRSCYACHLARSGANFERMKAGLAPIAGRTKDSHLDLLKRQKAERDDEHIARQFGDLSAKLWPMGRLEVTFPDGYVEPDMTKLSWQACMNALAMYPGVRDVLRWAGWSVD